MGEGAAPWGEAAAEGHMGGEEQRRADQGRVERRVFRLPHTELNRRRGGHQDLVIWLWAEDINDFGGFVLFLLFEKISLLFYS